MGCLKGLRSYFQMSTYQCELSCDASSGLEGFGRWTHFPCFGNCTGHVGCATFSKTCSLPLRREYRLTRHMSVAKRQLTSEGTKACKFAGLFIVFCLLSLFFEGICHALPAISTMLHAGVPVRCPEDHPCCTDSRAWGDPKP